MNAGNKLQICKWTMPADNQPTAAMPRRAVARHTDMKSLRYLVCMVDILVHLWPCGAVASVQLRAILNHAAGGHKGAFCCIAGQAVISQAGVDAILQMIGAFHQSCGELEGAFQVAIAGNKWLSQCSLHEDAAQLHLCFIRCSSRALSPFEPPASTP